MGVKRSAFGSKRLEKRGDVDMDIWDDDGKAIDRVPTAKPIGDDWYVDAENQHQHFGAARRRAVGTIHRPNQRAAVAVPLAGQSYHPSEEDHQQAVAVAVRKLEARKAAHEKFKAERALRAAPAYKGDLNTDKLWEEEVKAGTTSAVPAEKSNNQVKREAAKKKEEKKKAGKVKKNAIELRREKRRNKVHSRHPSRAQVADDVDRIDELQLEVDKQTRKSELKQIRKIVRRKEGQQLVKYGRNQTTTLVPDVLPSSELPQALRHMKPAAATHMAQDRVKSLEERGLVPARMRHTYNKRKILRPKGEVSIKSEQLGGVVDW
mmetsp:Transcript_3585/g.11213  ORF Transcript_3585/g.11213 Transcript_3585/m.11213 type:complete len:320 (-) Transcript_3585:89-1048(-)|eukprot:CAMPEP_0174856358 /NCGR_PEP_ID=MMETSP1114-20130205/35745_1 /TAXON_ID=312471 /ORGANISM="Neobodo designis, Strain CCAP 1951/1" /LENGTH=319 /DNA_ID=CAMNT_0016091153 /DNA_START=92 /DNA_END=1051 /DNA_ORIENTATION=+